MKVDYMDEVIHECAKCGKPMTRREPAVMNVNHEWYHPECYGPEYIICGIKAGSDET